MRRKHSPANCCNKIQFLHFKLTGYLKGLYKNIYVSSSIRHSTFYQVESFKLSSNKKNAPLLFSILQYIRLKLFCEPPQVTSREQRSNFGIHCAIGS